jgi:hypothetical protein
MFKVPEQYRVTNGMLKSSIEDGNNGLFILPSFGLSNLKLRAIASDGEGWEHVSVSTMRRIPTWSEMCYVKNKFWDEEDCVVQFHPSKSLYVNTHLYTLHLWSPIGIVLPLPPTELV